MAADRVFVTGGSGFLGHHVAQALLGGGYSVRCLVRGRAAADRLPAGCERVEGDLLSPGHLVRALDGCRFLVHTAAHYSFSPRDQDLIRRVNVTGTAGLLAAAHQAGLEKAVVTSSSATVGPAPAQRPADEDSWAAGDDHSSAYHASKLEQERAALAARIPTVLLLPTMPVGPGDWRPTPTGQMILDLVQGRMPAYPPGGANVVAVEDAAQAHLLALERGTPGRRYLVGGENLSLREIFDLVSRAAGRRPPPWPMPYRVAWALGWADQARCRLRLGKTPRVPLEGVRMSKETMYVTWERAARELGYRPRLGAREALEQAVAWYRHRAQGA